MIYTMLDNYCLICEAAPAKVEYIFCENCYTTRKFSASLATILHNFNRRLKEIERLHTDNKSLKDCQARENSNWQPVVQMYDGDHVK